MREPLNLLNGIPWPVSSLCRHPGKETRGAGTASATVRSELQADGAETRVVVHTSLNVTGRPAQFGRGVMADVSGKLIGIFADNLASMLAAAAPPETWRKPRRPTPSQPPRRRSRRPRLPQWRRLPQSRRGAATEAPPTMPLTC